jgi:hypothetical protein
MILQTGEGVTSRAATSRFGGRAWIDAVNRGDVSGAIGIMSGRKRAPWMRTPNDVMPSSVRDQFQSVFSAAASIDGVHRFGAAAPTPAAASVLTSSGKGDAFHMTFGPGAIQINSPNGELTSKQVQQAFLEGLHNGGAFRTTVIRKIRDGH